MQRLYFVQWLRVFLISLVVAHHAGQPYGPTGGEWPLEDPVNAEWLGPFFAVNAAFFMGFFFLIAGYFTGSSFDRKGGAAFVRDRSIRLGIPLAFVTFVLFGLFAYFYMQPPEGFFAFYFGYYIGGWNMQEGALWFVAQLLAYSLIYAAVRWLLSLSGGSDNYVLPVPGDRAILAYTVGLGVVDALVRTRYPQDVWVTLLWVAPTEIAHLPQYLSLFIVGILAGRGEWFTTLPTAVGARWFTIGAVAFTIMGVLVNSDVRLPIDLGIVWGFFEAFVSVGMILGLLVLFRAYCARPGRWLERLDGNVYGVYILHFFILIALQVAIVDLAWSATVKFLAVTAIGLVLSFVATALIRKVPYVDRVI